MEIVMVDKTFHACQAAFSKEFKKYKEKNQKEKLQFFDDLLYLKADLEKPLYRNSMD